MSQRREEETLRFLAKDGRARYDALQWMMVQMTTIGPMWGQYVHFMRFAPKGSDYSLDRYRTQVRKTLDVLEKRLGEARYLGGSEYSIADIATFPWVRNTGGNLLALSPWSRTALDPASFPTVIRRSLAQPAPRSRIFCSGRLRYAFRLTSSS